MDYLHPLVETSIMKEVSKPSIVSPTLDTPSTGNMNNNLGTFQDIQGSDNLAQSLAKATKSEDSSSDSNEKEEGSENTAISDERLKELFGESGTTLSEVMAGLDAYMYRYTEEAQSLPNAKNKGVDDEGHIGPMAQDLAKNPLTKDAVEEDPLTGYLEVNTKRLTLTDTAVLSELCKRVIALEKKIGAQ